MVTVGQAAMLMSGKPGDAAFRGYSRHRRTDRRGKPQSSRSKCASCSNDSFGIAPDRHLPKISPMWKPQLGLERKHLWLIAMDLLEEKGTYVLIAFGHR